MNSSMNFLSSFKRTGFGFVQVMEDRRVLLEEELKPEVAPGWCGTT